MSSHFRSVLPRLVRWLGVLLPVVLLLASSARAAETDDFQGLLQHAGLPDSASLPPRQPLSLDKAQGLWRGLLDSPATPRTFAPRTVLARLVREVISRGQPLPYDELLARTRRFHRLVVLRPDGYAAVALTGKPLARLGPPSSTRASCTCRACAWGPSTSTTAASSSPWTRPSSSRGFPWASVPWGGIPPPPRCWARRTHWRRSRTVEGLAQLPSAVAGLIASSPEYFARYGAMNLEDQVREAARLSLQVLTLQGGAATVGPRLASATRVPVLSVSARGALVLREVAVPAGTMTVVVGAGASSASIVLMAQGSGTGGGNSPWPPAPSGPGQWTQKEERMSAESQRYQSQVTGAPEGWVYRVRTGSGPKDFVDFDGFKNGVLLEVKGPGYQKLLQKMEGQEWFQGVEEMLKQARRQVQAAKGSPIQWHFAEREVAEFMRALFREEKLGGIKVVHTSVSP